METTNELRELLLAFTATKVYELNVGSKITVAAIFLAISLYELGEFQHRSITKDEEHWFDGSYSIAREFDSKEWENIPKLYDKIVEVVRGRNFFRS